MTAKPFKVKEAFYSLQGEGAQAGRAAVFCRFSKCNLWNGKEADRATAICRFCDTDILGTDGQNGGIFHGDQALIDHLRQLWPSTLEKDLPGKPYVIFTGGEPALQLTESLVDACHRAGFEVAIETNGTRPIPAGIDWICVSPKGQSEIILTHADELKLVYPQQNCSPERFQDFNANYLFLSPMASAHTVQGTRDLFKLANTQQALHYCLTHPRWRLSLQLHKILEID